MKCRAKWRIHALPGLMLTALLGMVSANAQADAGWFESGDSMLRMDLQLLNDAEVIRLPVNEWPIPRAAVYYAMGNAKLHFASNSAVAAALARVRLRLEQSAPMNLSATANAGQPGRLRDFDDMAREDGEIGCSPHPGGARDHMRIALRKQNQIALAQPQRLRADGVSPTRTARDDVVLDDALRSRHHRGGDHARRRRLRHPRRAQVEIEIDRAGQPYRAEHVGEDVGLHPAPARRTPGHAGRTVGQPGASNGRTASRSGRTHMVMFIATA